MEQQKQQAIQTALLGEWEKAISLNVELLENNPNDIETLNRLAFAYTVIGKTKEAKQTYQKVLDIDALNPIALRNIKKLGSSAAKANANSIHLNTDMFLEESGKTKMVTLLNTAQPQILKSLYIGQPLTIAVKRSKVFSYDSENRFIGMLPDNVGTRLIDFIKGGNLYEAYIKSVEGSTIMVFLRETKRTARFKNLPSFGAVDKSHFSITKNKSSLQVTEDSESEE